MTSHNEEKYLDGSQELDFLQKLDVKTSSKDIIKQQLVHRFLTPPRQIPYDWLDDWQRLVITVNLLIS